MKDGDEPFFNTYFLPFFAMTSWLGLFLSFFSHALEPKMTVLLINCFLITSRWPHWNGLMVYMEFNHAQFLYWTLAINIHIGHMRKKRSISSIGSINKGGNWWTQGVRRKYTVFAYLHFLLLLWKKLLQRSIPLNCLIIWSFVNFIFPEGWKNPFYSRAFSPAFSISVWLFSDEVFPPFLFGVGKLQSKFGKVLFDPL